VQQVQRYFISSYWKHKLIYLYQQASDRSKKYRKTLWDKQLILGSHSFDLLVFVILFALLALIVYLGL
jgi:hypothetical protein